MELSKVISIIESFAPLYNQAAWDSSGVQIACRRETISSIAVMLDPTPANIKVAIENKADFVLCHHPLALDPYKLNELNALHEVVRLLLCHDILLYSAHTSLDSSFEFSSWLADEFSLEQREWLDKEEQFGFVGDLKEGMDLESVINILKTSMPFADLKEFKFVGKAPAKIKRIACCTGSGSSLYEKARKAEAHIFITGDTKYHGALDIENIFALGFSSPLLLDVGHFCLEEEMMRRFALRLLQALGIRVEFIGSKNPFLFY